MSKTNDSLRRVAVLIDSVDNQTAGRFLHNISVKSAEQIRQQVIDLGRVSRAEREQVLQQFLFAVHGVQQAADETGMKPRPVELRVRAVSPKQLQANGNAAILPTKKSVE